MTDYGGGPSIWPQIALIVILTMINAFFAATEMAVVSLNKNKISQMADDGNKKASTILKATRFLLPALQPIFFCPKQISGEQTSGA